MKKQVVDAVNEQLVWDRRGSKRWVARVPAVPKPVVEVTKERGGYSAHVQIGGRGAWTPVDKSLSKAKDEAVAVLRHDMPWADVVIAKKKKKKPARKPARKSAKKKKKRRVAKK
jgi:hypothetical protein